MKPRIFWAGDSTVTQNDYTTYPQSGIGQGIRLFIKKEIEIKNHAMNGRSTKSFIDEFRLAPIYDEITKGDFLFIEFGHNDEKVQDPSRYTDPYGEYRINLEKYINVARNKGAYPVLITSLYRRNFLEDGTLSQIEHRDYQESMKNTAKECQVPCIDLCTASKKLLESTPKEISENWFMNLKPGEFPNFPEGKEDNTHLQWNGAMIFGRIVALGLKALGGRYADLLIEPDKLTGVFEGEIINE
ncbi:Rhamnogalacturonan acetylesterase RhgT [Clostridiales bacterium CHKCI001]|nr:Rhamnogalacturonan acetylesterase RhgT [Clostridiales bacterium CHKCI001]